jgi:hypothetical protein
LIALEYHTVFDDTVFVQVQPGAISALSPLVAIIEDPFPTLIISDSGLHFREKLILYPNVTIGCATNYNLLRLLLRVVIEAAKILRVRDGYNMSG